MFYRYLFGATLGEMWTWLRDERNHPMVAAMFGVPSADVLLDMLAWSSARHLERYQEISALLKQYS